MQALRTHLALRCNFQKTKEGKQRKKYIHFHNRNFLKFKFQFHCNWKIPFLNAMHSTITQMVYSVQFATKNVKIYIFKFSLHEKLKVKYYYLNKMNETTWLRKKIHTHTHSSNKWKWNHRLTKRFWAPFSIVSKIL